MGEKCCEKDVNKMIKIQFGNMNLAQLVFCQAVVFPAIMEIIDSYADALVGLGD